MLSLLRPQCSPQCITCLTAPPLPMPGASSSMQDSWLPLLGIPGPVLSSHS